MQVHNLLVTGAAMLLVAGCATPQPTDQQAAAQPSPAPAPTAVIAKPATAPAPPAHAAADSLQVLFDVGSANLSPSAEGAIDHATRLFREGNPVVMTVAGYADRDGAEFANLVLSGRRAETVKAAMVARGVPAERLELVAFGVAEPAMPADPAAPENRRVVISWR